MKPSADLFSLIKSLSPAEKRYLRVNFQRASPESESNSLRLFDAINGQETYDEEAIKTVFDGEAIARNLPSEKNYLFAWILRAMRSFHENHSIDNQLRNMLQEVDFLFDLKLFGPCRKWMLKAMAIAEKYDRFLPLVELIDVEVRLHKISTQTGLLTALKVLENKRMDLVERISLDLNVASAYDKVFAQAVQHYLPGKELNWEGLEVLERIKMEPGLKARLSFRRKLLLFGSYAMLGQMRGDRPEMIQSFQDSLDLYEQFPHFKEDEVVTYISSIGNLLASYHFGFQYERFPELLSKLDAIKDKSLAVEMAKLNNGKYYALLYHMAKADWPAAMALEKELKALLVQEQDVVPSKTLMGFYYNLGVMNLFRGDPKAALPWLQSILNLTRSEVRTDLPIASELLLLAAHFELENHDWVADHVRNLRRSFDRKDARNEFENTILTFFHKLCQSSTAHRKEIFANLDHELSNATDAQAFRQRTGFHEFRIWARHNALGEPMRTLIPNYWHIQLNQPVVG